MIHFAIYVYPKWDFLTHRLGRVVLIVSLTLDVVVEKGLLIGWREKYLSNRSIRIQTS